MRINSPASAESARRRLCYRLIKSGGPEAIELASVLDQCCDATFCRSAACPTCGLAFQSTAVSLVDLFIREPARAIRNRMHAITIVPASGCLPPEALSVDAWLAVRAEIAAVLANLDLPPALVGLEASFNEDPTGAVEPHWSVHGHAVGLDWLSPAQAEGLRSRFSRSAFVSRPVRVDRLDQDLRQGRFRHVGILIVSQRFSSSLQFLNFTKALGPGSKLLRFSSGFLNLFGSKGRARTGGSGGHDPPISSLPKV